jgi:hypothetical protein
MFELALLSMLSIGITSFSIWSFVCLALIGLGAYLLITSEREGLRQSAGVACFVASVVPVAASQVALIPLFTGWIAAYFVVSKGIEIRRSASKHEAEHLESLIRVAKAQMALNTMVKETTEN